MGHSRPPQTPHQPLLNFSLRPVYARGAGVINSAKSELSGVFCVYNVCRECNIYKVRVSVISQYLYVH